MNYDGAYNLVESIYIISMIIIDELKISYWRNLKKLYHIKVLE